MTVAFAALVSAVRGALGRPALSAWAWLYALCLASALVVATAFFAFVVADAGHSAVGEGLRSGLTADWLVDLVGEADSQRALAAVGVLAAVLAPVYLVLAALASGGLAVSALAAVAGEPREIGFLRASRGLAGVMARLAAFELFIVSGLAVGLVLLRSWLRGAAPGAAVMWAWLALAALLFALATTVFDVARVRAADLGERRAIGSFLSSMALFRRNPASFLGFSALACALALATWGGVAAIFTSAPRTTPASIVLGALVGQASVALRIWWRVAASCGAAALWRRLGNR